MTYNNILADQREFFLSGQTKALNFRIKQLKKFKKALKENEKYFYEAVYKDFGKSEFETYGKQGIIVSQFEGMESFVPLSEVVANRWEFDLDLLKLASILAE